MKLPEGFRIGHGTDLEGITGCTVILTPPGTVGGVEVRGGGPGTRETDLLDPHKTVEEVHALLFTGGSAFGLSAAAGVVRWLEERGIGYRTPFGIVPIVPAAVVFDLNIGDPKARPTPEMAYRACEEAQDQDIPRGSVGAGTGATVGKWAGPSFMMKGGLGLFTVEEHGLAVAALAVVNPVGDVLNPDGTTLAGAQGPDGRFLGDENPLRLPDPRSTLRSNTTLVAVLTDARLTKVQASVVARRAHNGIARVIRPSHTSFDGDTVFVLSSRRGTETPVDFVAEIAAYAVEEAIRDAVRSAAPLGGVPAL